jgi:cellulose synthase operon protein C
MGLPSARGEDTPVQTTTLSIWPPETPLLRVGDLCLDLRYRRLCTAAGEIELSSRVFDVLVLFLAEPNRLHTRESLLQRIWAGVVVEDGNLTQTVSVLRRLLGEERKLWIRTVAKRGYVFEPPGPVVPLALHGDTAWAEPEATTPEPSATPQQTSAAPLRKTPAAQRLPRWLASLAAALLLSLLGLGWWLSAAEGGGAAPQRRIALVALDDPGAGANTRWPAVLLQSWLEWQLSLAPEVLVLSAADLAAEGDGRSGVEVLMLSAVPTGSGRVRLQARSSGGASREAEGELASVDALADQISRAVLADLLPQRAAEPRPTLRLRADNAQRYVQAVLRQREHDWVPHLELLRNVVEQEPEFGLARWQLAQALLTFGQLRVAEAHFDRLDAWAQAWPGDARAILAAQRLQLRQHHAEAAQAFGALAQRFPNQAQFALDQGRALLRGGYAAEAIPLLAAPRWQRQPVALRIMALLNLSNSYGVMGDAANARAAALAAQELAEGAGWRYESAMAAQAVALADWLRSEGPELAARLDDVALRYDQAGDPLRGQLMRFYADLADPQRAPEHLPALLAAARKAGHQAFEFDALRRASFKYFRLGDFASYRRYLDEAATLAGSTAPWALHSIEFDRLNEDYLRGDFAGALARAERLRAQPGKGGLNAHIDVYIALSVLRQGRLADSEQVLERADPKGALVDKALRREAPEIVFSLACLRATVSLLRGEAAAAQNDFSRCASSSDPAIAPFGRLGEAEIALLGGDRGLAAAPLREVREGMNRVSGLVARWSVALEWAGLATRHGDAAAAREELQALLPAVAASGYRLMELDARLGLAEASLALGDNAAAETQLQAARHLAGEQDWLAQRRLGIAAAGLALARGEHGAAVAITLPLHARAAQVGDAASELAAHDLLRRAGAASPCSDVQHRELLTKSGMRGATLAWLLPRDGAPDLAQARP